MSFFEVEFPRNIGYKRLGSPVGFNTTVNQGLSGQEQRNKNWANSRGKWTIDLQTPPASVSNRLAYIQALEAFMYVVSGKGDAFRLYDHVDNSALAQPLSPITGSTTVYQLARTYTIGGRSYVRNITKPITTSVANYLGNSLSNTINVYISTVLQTLGSAYTIDYSTGLITFASAPGGSVTADMGYHYPVRFDSDDLPLQIEPSNVRGGSPLMSLHSLQLLEVPPPNY